MNEYDIAFASGLRYQKSLRTKISRDSMGEANSNRANSKNLRDWLKNVVDVEGEEFERIRVIPQHWDEDAWRPFPDVGVYQMTRLTARTTGNSCNAYYIRLRAGEVFPIHKHPNAVHVMIGVQGEASIVWRAPNDGTKFRTLLRDGKGVFVVTPETEHAILADRGVDCVFLVVNAPAEDIHRKDYQVHVHGEQ